MRIINLYAILRCDGLLNVCGFAVLFRFCTVPLHSIRSTLIFFGKKLIFGHPPLSHDAIHQKPGAVGAVEGWNGKFYGTCWNRTLTD